MESDIEFCTMHPCKTKTCIARAVQEVRCLAPKSHLHDSFPFYDAYMNQIYLSHCTETKGFHLHQTSIKVDVHSSLQNLK